MRTPLPLCLLLGLIASGRAQDALPPNPLEAIATQAPTADGWVVDTVKKTEAYLLLTFKQAELRATGILFRGTNAATLKEKFYAQLKAREEGQHYLYYGANTKLLTWPTIRYVMQDKTGVFQASLFVIAPVDEKQCISVLLESPVPSLRVMHDWSAMERLLLESFNGFAEAIEASGRKK